MICSLYSRRCLLSLRCAFLFGITLRILTALSSIVSSVAIVSPICSHLQFTALTSAAQLAAVPESQLRESIIDRVAAADAIRDEMRRRGLTEDFRTISALLKLYAGGDPHFTSSLLDELQKRTPSQPGRTGAGDHVDTLDLRGLTAEVRTACRERWLLVHLVSRVRWLVNCSVAANMRGNPRSSLPTIHSPFSTTQALASRHCQCHLRHRCSRSTATANAATTTTQST